MAQDGVLPHGASSRAQGADTNNNTLHARTSQALNQLQEACLAASRLQQLFTSSLQAFDTDLELFFHSVKSHQDISLLWGTKSALTAGKQVVKDAANQYLAGASNAQQLLQRLEQVGEGYVDAMRALAATPQTTGRGTQVNPGSSSSLQSLQSMRRAAKKVASIPHTAVIVDSYDDPAQDALFVIQDTLIDLDNYNPDGTNHDDQGQDRQQAYVIKESMGWVEELLTPLHVQLSQLMRGMKVEV